MTTGYQAMLDHDSPYFSVVPIIGVTVRGDTLDFESLWDQHWVFIDAEHFEDLSATFENSDAVLSYLNNHVWSTSGANSLLLYRWYGGQEIDRAHPSLYRTDRQDAILSMLNMAILLSDISETCGMVGINWKPPFPRSIYPARMSYLNTQRLTLNRQGVKSLSGSGWFLAKEDSSNGPSSTCVPTTNAVIQEIVEHSPTLIGQVISGSTSSSVAGKKLLQAARGILNAYESGTEGAFVSHLVGVAEMLVTSQTEGGEKYPAETQWNRRRNRLSALSREGPFDAVEEIVNVRHAFVHQGKQPESDRVCLRALAVVVQMWGLMEELNRTYSSHSEVMALLDCIAASKNSNIDELEALKPLVHRGPYDRVNWIRQALDGNATWEDPT